MPTRCTLSGLLLLFSLLLFTQPTFAGSTPRPGLNLSGGEFNPKGTRRGIDYDYPTATDVSSAADLGFRIVRLPFLARRLFGTAATHPADEPDDITRVIELVDTAARNGLIVVLDMHDYGFAHTGELIGSSRESVRDFAQTWASVATIFRSRPNVFFGLMNEPHFQTPAVWREASNQAIAAIRATGAKQGILVPSTDWSVASRWNKNGNAAEMLKISDPADNFAFELHQYFDPDESGTHDSVRAGIGASSLVEFTTWARSHGRRAFLGEFAWADTPDGEREGSALLSYMAANPDVWSGWAYWGGGGRWGNYLFALDASKGQMSVLKRFIDRALIATNGRS